MLSLSFRLISIVNEHNSLGSPGKEGEGRLIHDVNPSQLSHSGASHRSTSSVVARSIIGCAARHSNASRYK